MKISKNFNRYEFKCRCNKCNFATVDVELIKLLEKIRRNFNGKPITINSGSRCQKHNRDIGGHPKSKHTQGIAADIVIKGVPPLEIYQYVDSIAPNKYGLGCYKTFTHIDVQPQKKRWNG
jgi:uncharacterized protein YcbK (DUF882 family)